MQNNKIPENSLINKYQPIDYFDSFSKEFTTDKFISPDEFTQMAFKKLPFWIKWLFALRSLLVKPFGLETNVRFTDLIKDKVDNEIVYGMADSHLDFYVSMLCGELNNNKQELCITTTVKFNNTLGKIYFAVIKPFHIIIIKAFLNRVAK